jgi:hypothetical protein
MADLPIYFAPSEFHVTIISISFSSIKVQLVFSAKPVVQRQRQRARERTNISATETTSTTTASNNE